ncbi:Transcriptional regulator [Malassezia cuniculi]|uniref:Transcriptional regulator n=1 Tax=Malassezia cuniculi TaxID=948313 RepID=A0AAF0J6B1_9BASI|nr:Transcriptional regulator [Malassezia cuniculi]
MPQADAVPAGLRGAPAYRSLLTSGPPGLEELETLSYQLKSLAADAEARLAEARSRHRVKSESDDAPRRTLGVRLRANPGGRSRNAPVLPGAFDDDGTTFSWALPAPLESQLLPPQPPIRVPTPYARNPAEVDEDFATRDWKERERERDAALARLSPGGHRDIGRAKQTRDSAQVPISTFYNHVDAYFKPVTEDDLAWLSGSTDDPGPFVVPEKGPPYRQVWEREDAELLGQKPPPVRPETTGPPPGAALSLGELGDEHMHNQRAWVGPLVERLAAAVRSTSTEESKAGRTGAGGSGSGSGHAAGAFTSSGSGNGASAPLLPPPDVHKNLVEAETAAEDACTQLGLLDGVFRPSEAADDAVTTSLRRAQELLREQMQLNSQRKARLFHAAVERLAYQDYQACLQTVEREIENGWTKRQRQLRAPGAKKRRTEPTQLPESLVAALARRRQLKEAFEPLFTRLQHACTAPAESIYQGLG